MYGRWRKHPSMPARSHQHQVHPQKAQHQRIPVPLLQHQPVLRLQSLRRPWQKRRSQQARLSSPRRPRQKRRSQQARLSSPSRSPWQKWHSQEARLSSPSRNAKRPQHTRNTTVCGCDTTDRFEVWDSTIFSICLPALMFKFAFCKFQFVHKVPMHHQRFGKWQSNWMAGVT